MTSNGLGQAYFMLSKRCKGFFKCSCSMIFLIREIRFFGSKICLYSKSLENNLRMVWFRGFNLAKHTYKLEGGMNKDLMDFSISLFIHEDNFRPVSRIWQWHKVFGPFPTLLEFEKNVFP